MGRTGIFTYADQERAIEDGWGVFYDTSRQRTEVQRFDLAGRFADDAEARAYVEAQARAGNGLALRALAACRPDDADRCEQCHAAAVGEGGD